MCRTGNLYAHGLGLEDFEFMHTVVLAERNSPQHTANVFEGPA
jgi:hypothetical protein